MKNKTSLIALVVLFCVICILKYFTISVNELSWDVFGYYLYLPATFIHHDFMLNDQTWIHQVTAQYPITGTLYQLTQAPDNRTIYFFLMGMAILYAPFFLIGHFIASWFGYPTDGFSVPYQYSIGFGVLIYTLIGLYYVRKILLQYFSDKITAWVLVIVVIGTNYLHFVTLKNLETANSIFVLLSILIWNTYQWHQTHKLKNIMAIAAVSALITLVKPSECVCMLIPLLWGVTNKQTLRDKWKLIVSYKTQIFFALALGVIVMLPQMIYWKITTDHFIFDSYKNPGVGLDVFSPHILNVLFSFRKGWLIYTPIMIFALIGFVHLYKHKREIFAATCIYFLITFYIIASWTEWWYGAGYSIRPVVSAYCILALPLGFMLEHIQKQKAFRQYLMKGLIVLLICFNLFQMWQFNNYVLHPWRTTSAYYWSVFGRLNVPAGAGDLLSIERSNTGEDQFNDEYNYNRRNIGSYDFTERDTNNYQNYEMDPVLKNQVFRLDSNKSFSPGISTTYNGMTSKEYLWIKGSVDIKLPEGYDQEGPCLVFTFSRTEGAYGYKTACVDAGQTEKNKWITVKLDYLTPEIRNVNDHFDCYVWHRGRKPICIDNLKVDIFEKK